jgi:hydroxyacyl-ACP dehydratase HTD2-like protein with hotdog domain
VPPGFLFYVSTFGTDKLHADAGVSFDTGLFAGLRVEVVQAVRVGDQLTAHASVGRRHVHPASGATFVEIDCDYRRAGDLVLKETSTVAVLAASPPSASAAPKSTPAGFASDVPGAGFSATRLDVAFMASALRDPNPVHVDDKFAQRLGLPSAILHGPFVIFYAISQAAAGRWADVRSFDVQMRAPIAVGETVVAEVRHEGATGRQVRVVAGDGRLVAVGTVAIGS